MRYSNCLTKETIDKIFSNSLSMMDKTYIFYFFLMKYNKFIHDNYKNIKVNVYLSRFDPLCSQHPSFTISEDFVVGNKHYPINQGLRVYDDDASWMIKELKSSYVNSFEVFSLYKYLTAIMPQTPLIARRNVWGENCFVRYVRYGT